MLQQLFEMIFKKKENKLYPLPKVEPLQPWPDPPEDVMLSPAIKEAVIDTNYMQVVEEDPDTIIINSIKEIYKNHGIIFEDFNIFGIRDSSDMDKDIFNDFIGIIQGDKIYLFEGSTDPGVYFTKNPLNSKGTAHLCSGNYPDVYLIGKHAGKYEALVQQQGPVTVWRDKNQNFENDDNIIETGYFGLNIHSAFDAKKIGKNSAGCQIIRYKKDYKEFMNLCKNSGKSFFSYFLFERNLLPFDIELE